MKKLSFICTLSVSLLLAAPASFASWPSGGLEPDDEGNLLGDALDGAGGMYYLSVGSLYRIDRDGDLVWPSPVLISAANLPFLNLISDDAGGAILVYQSGSPFTVRAFRIDADGNHLWGSGGIAVVTSPNMIVTRSGLWTRTSCAILPRPLAVV
jgi:hypothetical protein